MTDGNPTNSSVSIPDLKTHLGYMKGNYSIRSSVYSLGFGSDHDASFMSELALAGSELGSYSYIQDSGSAVSTLVASFNTSITLSQYENYLPQLIVQNNATGVTQATYGTVTTNTSAIVTVSAGVLLSEDILKATSSATTTSSVTTISLKIGLLLNGTTIYTNTTTLSLEPNPAVAKVLDAQVLMAESTMYSEVMNYLTYKNQTAKDEAQSKSASIFTYMRQVNSTCSAIADKAVLGYVNATMYRSGYLSYFLGDNTSATSPSNPWVAAVSSYAYEALNFVRLHSQWVETTTNVGGVEQACEDLVIRNIYPT